MLTSAMPISEGVESSSQATPLELSSAKLLCPMVVSRAAKSEEDAILLSIQFNISVRDLVSIKSCSSSGMLDKKS